jgi:type III pantothenate kinase
MRRSSRLLQIDLGNSRLKWRLLRDGQVETSGTLPQPSADLALLPTLEAVPEAVEVASVASEALNRDLATQVMRHWGLRPWFARSEAECLGLRSSYAQPGLLGVDRWLAMLAAWSVSGRRVCVVDSGSALTIDLVAADGRHEGGYILPGDALMRSALLRDTQRVRFEGAVDAALRPGTSTAEAVCHGTALAHCGAVRLALAQAAADGEPVQLVLTGGGGARLADLLSEGACYRPDLVFEGLSLAAQAAH